VASVKTVDREELKAKMDQGEDFVLLEVLSEASYRREHLPGAIRYGDVEDISEVAPDKGTEIIAYCSNFN
jgi:rhodanese-related sulfurtransferase